jgi:hypothetical protein
MLLAQVAFQVPQDAFSVITAVFSSGAFLISVIALWLSYFRGPAIEQVANLDVKLASKDTYPGEASSFELERVPLVLLNSGSRAGVITEIVYGFIASEPFRKFSISLLTTVFDQFAMRPPHQDPESLPVSIVSGSSIVIPIDGKIAMRDWKDLSDLELIHEATVGKSILKMLEDQKARVVEFRGLLKSESDLGTVTIEAVMTERKRLRTRQSRKVIMPPKKLIVNDAMKKRLTSYEENFKSFYPRPADLIREIGSVTHQIVDELTKNIEQFTSQLEPGKYAGAIPNTFQQVLDSPKGGILVVKYQSDFVPRLQTLVQEFDSYNSKINGLAFMGKAASLTAVAAVDKMRIGLKSESETLRTAIQEWRDGVLLELQGLL